MAKPTGLVLVAVPSYFLASVNLVVVQIEPRSLAQPLRIRRLNGLLSFISAIDCLRGLNVGFQG